MAAAGLPQAASSSAEMSAPAMNVLPAPIRTTAAICGSAAARAIASMMACGTRGANRVDGRIVDGDQRDVLANGVVNRM